MHDIPKGGISNFYDAFHVQPHLCLSLSLVADRHHVTSLTTTSPFTDICLSIVVNKLPILTFAFGADLTLYRCCSQHAPPLFMDMVLVSQGVTFHMYQSDESDDIQTARSVTWPLLCEQQH